MSAGVKVPDQRYSDLEHMSHVGARWRFLIRDIQIWSIYCALVRHMRSAPLRNDVSGVGARLLHVSAQAGSERGLDRSVREPGLPDSPATIGPPLDT